MMKKIPLFNFRSLAPDELPLEITRIEAMPKIAMVPIPSQQTFYEIYWVTEGNGKHFIDFVEYDSRPNSLHLSGPGQVRYWDINTPIRGYAILFEPTLFMVHGEKGLLNQLSFFQPISSLSTIYPTASDATWFQNTFEQIEKEFIQQNFARSLNIVSWLQLLLVQIQRIILSTQDSSETVFAENHLINRYLRLVEKHAASQHKVEWYASELGVTITYLSKIVKEMMGVTAGAILRKRIVLEAKRLLVHTELTVAEVATELNFEDASYFGRFFKRETKQTPRTFSKHFATKYQNQLIN